jgi:hypothetical protein
VHTKVFDEKNLLKEKHSGGLARHFGHEKKVCTVE